MARLAEKESQLQLSQLRHVTTSRAAATSLAENYTGYPPLKLATVYAPASPHAPWLIAVSRPQPPRRAESVTLRSRSGQFPASGVGGEHAGSQILMDLDHRRPLCDRDITDVRVMPSRVPAELREQRRGLPTGHDLAVALQP